MRKDCIEKNIGNIKIDNIKEAFKLLSAWGCKFEETVFYRVYCKNNNQKMTY